MTDSRKHLVTIMKMKMTTSRLSPIKPRTGERENSKRMTQTVRRRMVKKRMDILSTSEDSEGEEEEEDSKEGGEEVQVKDSRGLEIENLTIEIQLID